MLVKEIMQPAAITISPRTFIAEAAEKLHKNNLTILPVVNDFGVVTGVVGEKELFSSDYKFYLPMYITMIKETDFVMGGSKELPYEAGRVTRVTAEEIMNKKVPFASPDWTLEKLSAKFGIEGVYAMPVVDASNKLLGIVHSSDVLKHFGGVDIRAQAPHPATHVDDEVDYVQKNITSKFAFVTKTKANIWIITATVLFIIGFLAGVIYVANPDIFKSEYTNGLNR